MQQRKLTIRLIRVAMGAALIAPCLLFAFASWNSYRNLAALTDERLMRSLDIQQEEAKKAFELVNLSLQQATELVSGMSVSEIRANEQRLHLQLKRLADAIAVVQSIWIYDTTGGVLVSSYVHPPPEKNFSDRDFIQAHVKSDAGTYYGQVYNSVLGAEPFFTVSRRLTRNGEFIGIVEASVLPSNFYDFYATLAYTTGLQYALIRGDGLLLARYPAAPPGATDRLDPGTRFHRAIAERPEGDAYTATSPIDHVERQFIVRRFGDTPLYLTAGVATATMRNELIHDMAAHLIYGIPVTLVLFLTLFLVLRRTQRLYTEIDLRTAAEDSLRQSQRLEAVGHLTGGVAHDFNNLLTIIIGNLEMAQRQLQSWSEGAQARLWQRLDSAMQGAQRAATLTKRLLAFSRQQPLNPVPVDVNRLLSGLSDFLSRAIGEDVSLEIVGGAGLWPVEADAAELDAAILNLAVNARDAMPHGGKLTIETNNSYLDESYCRQHPDIEPGQYVQIAVTDTGAGMSKATIERAFEPFFTTKRSGQGTGLGLSQVYGFVKQSGGHVKIYSELGEGTTIKIYLRRYLGNYTVVEEPKYAPGRGRSGECILVVEDDSDVRAYVVETLRGLGYDVLEAGDAEEALRLVNDNENISLLLTDVVMPVTNGRQLSEKAKERRPSLKVVFMTGYSRNAIVHQGRLDPGVELIQKPLTSEQLAATVRKVLDVAG